MLTVSSNLVASHIHGHSQLNFRTPRPFGYHLPRLQSLLSSFGLYLCYHLMAAGKGNIPFLLRRPL